MKSSGNHHHHQPNIPGHRNPPSQIDNPKSEFPTIISRSPIILNRTFSSPKKASYFSIRKYLFFLCIIVCFLAIWIKLNQSGFDSSSKLNQIPTFNELLTKKLVPQMEWNPIDPFKLV